MSLPSSKTRDAFTVHQEEPINAEPSTSALLAEGKDSFITPREVQYMRNHGEILQLQRQDYKISIEIEDDLKSALNLKRDSLMRNDAVALDDMLEKLGRTDLTAALQVSQSLVNVLHVCAEYAKQCAGNRRSEMNERHETEGIQWGAGTILNAEWAGIPLRSLLLDLGVPPELPPALRDAHVHFHSQQSCEQADCYEASIPVSVAMDENRCVLLADRMNGQALPSEHGGPLRVVVPGYIGARSVKWLQTLKIKKEQSKNFYMTSDYKKLPENVGPDEKEDWMPKVEPLGETGLQSAIGKVTQIPATSGRECIRIQGYAYDGRGSAIQSVQVCAVFDGSRLSQEEVLARATADHWVPLHAGSHEREWLEASLYNKDVDRQGEEGKVWSWTLFSVDVPVHKAWKGKELALICKARTVDGSSQESLGQWNVRGVLEDGYGQYRHFVCE